MRLLAIASASVLLAAGSMGMAPAAGPERLTDPARPVTEITRQSFTLQYYTREPAETRVQVRKGDHSLAVLRSLVGEPERRDADEALEVNGEPGERTLHRVTIDGLEPGQRYFYRVWDPGAEPTSADRDWGAGGGWRREFAVATLAPDGARTIVRHPVKVLLMPNVINVESAAEAAAEGADVPPPEPFSAEQLDLMRAEFARASRFFFINSNMRFWVDFEIVVDDRWQRWGPEVTAETHPDFDSSFYTGWPVCRSYAGTDYRSPGGGGFTLVDVRDPQAVHEVAGSFRERDPFPSQIEVAFPRRWRQGGEMGEWWYYTSGGGTLGVDSIPRGMPGRSQFLGGYDTCWLATHEFHHQMESLGAISLAFREDERIVFNHWSPRSRSRAPDAASGPEGEQRPHPWTTSARHGEHYDGMAYWDRTLSEAQWLRMMLGEVVTVTDADGDGVPDDDSRLPLDENRFGSDPSRASTDGVISDFDKIMLSTWAPAPLQVSDRKPEQVFARPDPRTADSDGDGRADDVDPAPLVPHEPFIWPGSATIDGEPGEWEHVPLSGSLEAPEATAAWQHQHDERAYTALITLRGEWARARIVLDGEGEGVYSGVGVQAFEIRPGRRGEAPELRPTFVGTRNLSWKSSVTSDGAAHIEIEIRNTPDDADPRAWFWQGAGREVGVTVEVESTDRAIYSMYEPYVAFYCRMLESSGQPPAPGSPPEELTREAADVVLRPDSDAGAPRVRFTSDAWKVDGDAWQHTGHGESALLIENLAAGDFDLLAVVEAKQDAILGAYVQGQPQIGATHDYCMFVGGYSNTKTRLRLFGKETGDSGQMVERGGGRHTMQLSRRGGVIWGLWDGNPILWAYDPRPEAVVDRLAVLGGYGGQQRVFEIRYRFAKGQ